MRDDEAVADEATEVIVTRERSENSAATTENGRVKRSKNSKKKEQKSKAKPERADSNQEIKARFAACQRCCYFLGSYISLHGEAALETAALNSSSDWLTFTWDQQTRNLVHKAFGVRLDVDFYHFESCCVACCRQFVYESDAENKAVFRVRL
jgi:hypothetical protein